MELDAQKAPQPDYWSHQLAWARHSTATECGSAEGRGAAGDSRPDDTHVTWCGLGRMRQACLWGEARRCGRCGAQWGWGTCKGSGGPAEMWSAGHTQFAARTM